MFSHHNNIPHRHRHTRNLLQADLHFDDSVGGVEGHLNDVYQVRLYPSPRTTATALTITTAPPFFNVSSQNGYVVLTDYRLIWASYGSPQTPFDPVSCHIPLASISNSELAKAFLALKPPRIRLHVRLNAVGYPSSDPMTVESVSKVKILPDKEKSGKVELWHTVLTTALQKQAWKSAPPGLLQEMHTSAGVAGAGGPITPPPSSTLLQPHLTPDPTLLRQLQQMGYSKDQASQALVATENKGVQEAANWLLDGGPHPPSSQTPPVSTSTNTITSTTTLMYNPLVPQWPPPGMLPTNTATTTTPVSLAHTSSSLHHVGVGGVLHREEQRAENTDRMLGEAFSDLTQLMQMAEEMVKLAEGFRTRASRGQLASTTATDEEEDQMDDDLATELVDLGIASPITRESCGRQYYLELARQVSAVMEGPVAAAGGVLPLPDVYRRFCRARFTDIVSPDDLLQAVHKLPDVGGGSTLRLKIFPSGVKALVKIGADDDTVRKIIDLLFSDVKNSTTAGSTYEQVIGQGVGQAKVASALGVPLSVAADHLEAAEAAGLLCRDDGPEGLKFYKNFFATLEEAELAQNMAELKI